MNSADLPWKWIKRLATSDERVNHDSQWKCTTSAECKTGISAVLTVTSGWKTHGIMGSYFTMMLMLMFNHYCHIAIVYDYDGTGA